MVVDPFTARLIELRLNSVVEEMATSLLRTSGSPAITEAKDFATALFDAEGELASFGGYAAFHLGSAMWGLRSVRDIFKDDEIEPGDAFVVNDPYTSGALHVGDIGIIWPVFVSGRIVAWCFANAHMVDVGGMSPGGLAAAATDCFSEGLMFPPSRIIREGQLLPDWKRFIENNVRMPVNVIGDLRSLMAADVTAERRIIELIEEFGADTFAAALEVNKDSAERTIRARLASLPDADMALEEWLDYDRGDQLTLHRVMVRFLKRGETAVVDLSGSGQQCQGPVNTCRAGSYGTAYTAFAQKLGWDLPLNAGIFRPLEIVLGQSGTVVNAEKPAPVSLGHVSAGGRVMRGVSGLLTELMQASSDADVRGQISGTGSEAFVRAGWLGRGRDGRYTAFLNQDQIPGLGARACGDGLDAGGYQFGAGVSITDVEVAESLYPMLYLWRRLSPDSGGAGQFRGGLGIDLAWTPWGTGDLAGTMFCTGSRFPGRGELGGRPGGTGFIVKSRPAHVTDVRDDVDGVTWTELPSFGAGVPLQPGDVLRVWSAGGGGLGDPRDRDPELVQRDLDAGWVTPRGAELYDSATRRDDGPGAGDEAGQLVSGPLASDATGGRACAACGQSLATWSEPLSAHAAVTDEDLVEALSQAGAHVKRDLPGRVLRTLACPGCAGVLSVEILWQPGDHAREIGPGAYLVHSTTSS